MTHTTVLDNPQEAHVTLQRLWGWLKPRLLQGQRITLSVEEERRSLPQNAKFHALCRNLEFARVEWAGKPRCADEWKVLLISGHAVATKAQAEVVPGLEREFVNLRESTSRMDRARMSSLIEYAEAFAAMRLPCPSTDH